MNSVSPVLPGSESIEVVLGRGQPQYVELPAVYLEGDHRPMLTRWRLTDEEREAVAAGADIVLTQLTWRNPFQPIHLQICDRTAMPVLLEEEPR